jgi:hypothetical protein
MNNVNIVLINDKNLANILINAQVRNYDDREISEEVQRFSLDTARKSQ